MEPSSFYGRNESPQDAEHTATENEANVIGSRDDAEFSSDAYSDWSSSYAPSD